MRTLGALLIVAFIASIGCGSSPTTPSSADVSGTWGGFDSARSSEITMSLAQNGTGLNGTWSVSSPGHGGTLSGSKNGANVSLNLLGNATTCSLSFTGTLSNLTTLAGTIAG